MPDDPLHGLRQQAETAATVLGLDHAIELRAADDWGMVPGEQFTIYCGRATDDAAHIVQHYVAHARMLERGWQQPVLAADTDTAYAVANRSVDTFTDFFAYRLVADRLGPDVLINYTDWIAEMDADALLDDLAERYDHPDLDAAERTTYLAAFAVDWFGMAPALLAPHHPDRAAVLDDRWAVALASDALPDASDDLADRVSAVRTLFSDYADDAGYRSLLPDDQATATRAYYRAAWAGEPPAAITGFMSLQQLIDEETPPG